MKAQKTISRSFHAFTALCLAGTLAAFTAPRPAEGASYIQDPEIRWTVSVFNSPNTAQRFTREPVYLLNIGADRVEGWVKPRNAVNLEKETEVIPRGSSKPLSGSSLFDGLTDDQRAGDRVEVYLLRRSQGSQTKTMLASSGTLSYELQRYITEGGIEDDRIPNAVDMLLTRLARDDDDTLGGFMMRIRRLSAGQIAVKWSPIGDSQMDGEPTKTADNKSRPSISTEASFFVGQSIYPYQVRVNIWVASYRQAIGIENIVWVTAPLPQGEPVLPESPAAPLPQNNVGAPLPQGNPPAPAPPPIAPFNGDLFPCSRAGLNRSNLCILQPYPAKRGSTVSVVWRITDFISGAFDSGDGRGFVGPINAEMRIDLPKVNAPRTIRLKWIDSGGRTQEDSFAIQLVD